MFNSWTKTLKEGCVLHAPIGPSLKFTKVSGQWEGGGGLYLCFSQSRHFLYIEHGSLHSSGTTDKHRGLLFGKQYLLLCDVPSDGKVRTPSWLNGIWVDTKIVFVAAGPETTKTTINHDRETDSLRNPITSIHFQWPINIEEQNLLYSLV